MHYDTEELNELCKKIDLFDYVEQSQHYAKKSGGLYFYHCKRHSDSDPSVCLYPESWHCYSCGKGGNIINWFMYEEGLTYDKAVEKLQKLTGTQLKEIKHSPALKYYKRIKKSVEVPSKPLFERQALDFQKDYIDKYVDEIPDEWVSEGISPDILRKFNIRIDHDGNRIVYPIYDNNGVFIGVKGRTRLKKYKELNISKYMNYYKIGTVDYFAGLKENLEYINKTKSVIIFEGLKSVMKLNTWGEYNSVAAETSILNKGQIQKLLQLGVTEVTIAFDKGIDLSKIKQCIQILKRFCKVYVVYDVNNLLDDKDAPVDKGKEIWERMYRERKHI